MVRSGRQSGANRRRDGRRHANPESQLVWWTEPNTVVRFDPHFNAGRYPQRIRHPNSNGDADAHSYGKLFTDPNSGADPDAHAWAG